MPDRPFSDWIEEARYYLLDRDGTSNALFLQRVSIIATNGPLPGFAPAAIGVRANRELTILFCYPFVRHLEMAAAAELLKHELLHYVFGHVSERGKELRETYGDEIVLIAMDLVVNQHCDEPLLAKNGLPGVTVEKFGFERNLTTEQYCRLLRKSKLPDKFSKIFQNVAQAGEQDIDELAKAGKDGAGAGEAAGGPGVLAEIFANSRELDPELRDEAVVKAIQDAREEAEKTGVPKGRGWDAGEAVEFIARIKRPPAVRWQSYVRKMASSHMNFQRVSTRRRPSRRHPSYFGRVKRMGADMWLAIDTSGSMGEYELQLVDPEARALARQDVLITVIHVDAGVAKMETYDPHKGLVEFAGRGGTDFSPVFFELDRIPRAHRPGFLVYFTDGFGCCSRYLEERPGNAAVSGRRPKTCPCGIETLWLIPEGCTPKEDFMGTVPFGDVLVIPRLVGAESGAGNS